MGNGGVIDSAPGSSPCTPATWLMMIKTERRGEGGMKCEQRLGLGVLFAAWKHAPSPLRMCLDY